AIRDITERKQAGEANAQLSRAIEQADETIVITDAKGTIQYVNPAFEKITGYTTKEAIGQNPRVLKSGQHDDAFYKKMWETLTNGNEWRGELINKKKDGTFYTENATISPVFDSQGEIINYVAAKNDITETKRLQELESRAQRLETAGTIAGQVAHDFNNLLAPLMAYPEIIRDELPKNHSTLKYLDQIEKASHKIAEINQDLLTLGRRGHYNQKVLNLNTVIQGSLEELKPYPKTLACEINLGDDLMDILGGGAQLHRMISNLLHNGIDAMQDIGQITIKTENYYVDDVSIVYGRVPKGEYVKLTISDTGCGISDDIVQKIFDPFFTSKTTDKKRGSGLGMSVVDAVIRDHNGYIDLNTKIGEGTSFYIYFPITRELMDTQDSDKISGGNETVLVVDDDDMQREVSSQMLKKLGYKVSTVKSGKKAVEFLKENPQDLVILDMIMPNGIDGTETYLQILEINSNQKAIILSGYSESDRVLKVQRLGAGAYVKKPITKKVIGAAVRTELDRPVEISKS
ncbi:MAG: PAS domain S-box protein, partial [candidate division Zixibacteria bacterium]|nr:PAS domain S-box protein [candidate division Zixibacteria bacterium]